MNKSKISKIQIIQILDLYTCCPYNQIKNIASILILSNETISRIIQEYLKSSEHFYEKPNNLLILHSSINTQE